VRDMRDFAAMNAVWFAWCVTSIFPDLYMSFILEKFDYFVRVCKGILACLRTVFVVSERVRTHVCALL